MTAEVGGPARTDPVGNDAPDIVPDAAGLAAKGVTIRGLRKRYGDTVALSGLDLDARPGEILGVAGPNGAGKSTMVKILAGELAGDEGEIAVDGAAWSSSVGWQRV
ncbi:MAG: ribose transport system ATP-binding protein, partial [Chloroflexota bacterium]|nr:ribose transport system ATP-binding protein [Chloroflexota bacterium]